MKNKTILLRYLFFLTLGAGLNDGGFCQENGNISLDGKSVMYRMGGRIFYGRQIKNLPIVQQEVAVTDSSAIMKVKKTDVFGSKTEINLNPITDSSLTLINAGETGMKVRTADVFGEIQQRNLDPIPEQKMTLVETSETAGMKVRASDAFGNITYENLNPITQKTVLLLDEKETVMRVTTTDAFGNFAFENLNPDGNYKIKLQMETDPNLPKDDMIYIANNSGEVFQTFKIDGGKDFVFSTLSAEYAKMNLMEAVEVGMEK